MPTPVNKVGLSIGVIITVSILLVLVTLGIIWNGTKQMFSMNASPAMQDIAYNYGTGGTAVAPSAPAGAPSTIARGEVATDGYADKSMMPPVPYPTSGGATPEDRARVGEKIIRNGSLTLRVDDATKRLEEVRGITTELGGFVQQANIQDNAGVKTAYITIRIPTDKYTDAANRFKKLASTVFIETENAQDVTDQYVDLDARLKSARAEEEQYLAILKQSHTIDDTLQVTARLADVRTRIEQMDAQMRNLTGQTSYATLSLTLTEETHVEAPTRVWKPLETFHAAIQSLIENLQGLADALIAFAVFFIGLVLPILIGLAIIAWIIRAIVKRMMK